MGLSPEEKTRYGRQMMLPDFGEAGQEKLKQSQVLIAGVGGLGSPLGFYLAAAGVGRIVLADSDSPDLSNLNRQILHWEKDLGRPKVDSAAEKLSQLNSAIEVIPRRERITEETAEGLVEGCDLIIDALDNFETRHLLNRVSVATGIPLLYGGIHSLTGMLSLFIPGRTACLSCIFPGTIPPEVFPVLGATPGVIATLQATEAVKYLVGFGELLENKLLIYNGLEMSFHQVEISADEGCKVCGSGSSRDLPAG